jgi:hypothetical protein
MFDHVSLERAALEQQLTAQAELAYNRVIQDWKATGTKAPNRT